MVHGEKFHSLFPLPLRIIIIIITSKALSLGSPALSVRKHITASAARTSQQRECEVHILQLATCMDITVGRLCGRRSWKLAG